MSGCILIVFVCLWCIVCSVLRMYLICDLIMNIIELWLRLVFGLMIMKKFG